MKNRATALLVHGMGNTPAWWRPIAQRLEKLQIEPVPLVMPSLEVAGPESWVETVLRRKTSLPVLVIGHSLGAAVALQAARMRGAELCILLAMPPFLEDYTPPPPEGHTCSMTALARVTRFLRSVCGEGANGFPVPAVHIVGGNDRYVPIDKAGQLPIPVVPVSGATHELNTSLLGIREIVKAVVVSDCGRRRLDPGVRFVETSGPSLLTLPRLDAVAPSPARIDVEVTSRCQLRCKFCARAVYPPSGAPRDMHPDVFAALLEQTPFVNELNFVGLGEPLLHPELETLCAYASGRRIPTRVVTNGISAKPSLLSKLLRAGLQEVTFSIDTVDPVLFSRLRGGACLERICENLRQVPQGLRRSVFTTLSRENRGALPAIISLAADLGLPAVAVSDVNFPENYPFSLNRCAEDAPLIEAIRSAHEQGILLVTPHFHNISDLPGVYHRYRALLPADIAGRAGCHKNCLAPWRIAVISVDCILTPCNCAPGNAIGSCAAGAFEEHWNGDAMKSWRQGVVQGVHETCRFCPRY
jgi:MoaA/NifB/PqqE/SkfB family radical SAM enzyme/predicted alpha/beta hydrolase family esterase